MNQNAASNLTYPALNAALKDLYPVKIDLARDYEDLEYVIAMIQDDWHRHTDAPSNERWDHGSFCSGLLKTPGATTVLRESVSARLARTSGSRGFDLLSLSGLFGYLPQRAIDARDHVDERLAGGNNGV